MAASGQGRKRLRSRCGCSLRFPRWRQNQPGVASHAMPRARLPPAAPRRHRPLRALPGQPASCRGGVEHPGDSTQHPHPPTPPGARGGSAAPGPAPGSCCGREAAADGPLPGPAAPRPAPPGPPGPPARRRPVSRAERWLPPPAGQETAQTPLPPPGPRRPPRSRPRSPAGPRPRRTPKRGSGPGPPPRRGDVGGGNVAAHTGGPGEPGGRYRERELRHPQAKWQEAGAKAAIPNPLRLRCARQPQPGGVPPPLREPRDPPLPEGDPQRRASLDALGSRGQPGRGTPSPERPLAPSPHTGAAAARPRRRHVLSPVECAKSLPDVHGGRSDPPPLPPGQPPGTGDPRAQHRGTEPITGWILPGHGAQPGPVPRRRGPEARQRPGSGWQGAAGGATKTRRVAVSPSH
ncbi:proline-rich protein 2-like [Aphelocoma coerulescens]|uniref:proline-rich protein 2-like n=1 Tax=Aphelocoma coerulescens TaxID=39617 RepID=UPI003604E606